MNPASPGLNFHRLDKARDKDFWSVRVNADVRLIVHRTSGSLLLCYVDHHDRAYDWAERRKLETHPKTGAAQLVQIRETVKEIVVPVITYDGGAASTQVSGRAEALPYVRTKPRLFENVGDDADLQEVYDTERHLLYVACTRARDALSHRYVRSIYRQAGLDWPARPR